MHIMFIIYFTDDEVDSWFWISTPWPTLSILTVYLLFVLKLGPEMMQNREPLKIKLIIMAYNLIQTLYNLYIVLHVSLFLVLKYFICKIKFKISTPCTYLYLI